MCKLNLGLRLRRYLITVFTLGLDYYMGCVCVYVCVQRVYTSVSIHNISAHDRCSISRCNEKCLDSLCPAANTHSLYGKIPDTLTQNNSYETAKSLVGRRDFSHYIVNKRVWKSNTLAHQRMMDKSSILGTNPSDHSNTKTLICSSSAFSKQKAVRPMPSIVPPSNWKLTIPQC